MVIKVLLHGSGAVGSIYVWLLQNAGCDVSVTCRSNYSVVKEKGLLIDSEKYGKNIRVNPRVFRTPGEAATSGDVFDYVLVCTKALPDAHTARVIGPVVTKGSTTVVLIQNGIGIEEEYQSAFPENPLLSCVVYLPTTETSLGHIEMGNVELLEFGTFPASAYSQNSKTRSAADNFLAIAKKGGSNVQLHDDIQLQRWKKLLLNAPWNPICALTLSRDVAFLTSSPGAEKAIEDVMLEVVAIAQALGYESITAAGAREQLERAAGRIGGKGIEPSMLVDILNERKMEVEVILGNPVKIAHSLGISVPRMEILYYLTKALNEAVELREPGKSLDGLGTRAAREHKDIFGAA